MKIKKFKKIRFSLVGIVVFWEGGIKRKTKVGSSPAEELAHFILEDVERS
jgi:hypothetical protein